MRRQVMDAVIIAAVLLAATQLYLNGTGRKSVRPSEAIAVSAAR